MQRHPHPKQRPSSTSSLNISTLVDRDELFNLDENRLFYFDGGQFKHDWSVVVVDLPLKRVRIQWQGNLEVVLYGVDAAKFLRITRSRYAKTFEEASEATTLL
jgi:hypothetical protein